MAMHRRLQKELLILQNKTLLHDGIALEEPSLDSLWEAAVNAGDGNDVGFIMLLAGPRNSSYEGGVFRVQVAVSPRYPLDPPKMEFLTPIYHPNVDFCDCEYYGEICLDLLYKKFWSPALNLESTLLSIASLVAAPYPWSASNKEAARLYVKDQSAYDRTVREWVKNYARPQPQQGSAAWVGDLGKDDVASQNKGDGSTQQAPAPEQPPQSQQLALEDARGDWGERRRRGGKGTARGNPLETGLQQLGTGKGGGPGASGVPDGALAGKGGGPGASGVPDGALAGKGGGPGASGVPDGAVEGKGGTWTSSKLQSGPQWESDGSNYNSLPNRRSRVLNRDAAPFDPPWAQDGCRGAAEGRFYSQNADANFTPGASTNNTQTIVQNQGCAGPAAADLRLQAGAKGGRKAPAYFSSGGDPGGPGMHEGGQGGKGERRTSAMLMNVPQSQSEGRRQNISSRSLNRDSAPFEPTWAQGGSHAAPEWMYYSQGTDPDYIFNGDISSRQGYGQSRGAWNPSGQQLNQSMVPNAGQGVFQNMGNMQGMAMGYGMVQGMCYGMTQGMGISQGMGHGFGQWPMYGSNRRPRQSMQHSMNNFSDPLMWEYGEQIGSNWPEANGPPHRNIQEQPMHNGGAGSQTMQASTQMQGASAVQGGSHMQRGSPMR